jgi:fructose-1,6-bisphosphatase/inositol monophosphatase family enzyme
VATDTVQFALVGDLFGGKTWFAARGEGAFYQDRPISTSSVTQLADALLNCDLDHEQKVEQQSRILASARGVRAFGAATQSLVMVASGALDAHLDLRGLLTPENFLAPALLITEAGGLMTDPTGQPLPEVRSLTETYSVIASATPELHQLLISALSTKV